MLKVPENIKSYDSNLPNCVIIDLDNTVAYHVERVYYDWDKILTDWCDPRYVNFVEHFINSGVHVVFLSGRPYEKAFMLSKEWLEKHFGPMEDENCNLRWQLILTDGRHSSAEAKKLAYEQLIEGKYNVLCSIDDSQACVDMWRKLGILTLQSNNGMA